MSHATPLGHCRGEPALSMQGQRWGRLAREVSVMSPHRRDAYLVYCVFQLVWLPLTLAAYVLFVVKMILYGRRSGC